MDADAGLRWLTPRRRQALRLALVLSFFIWLFVRPLRDGVSMWVPFAAFAGVEIHFFATGLLARTRQGPRASRGGGGGDLFGDGPARALEEGDDLEAHARGDLGPGLRPEHEVVIVVDDVLARNLEDCGPDPGAVDGPGFDLDVPGLFRRAWPFELGAGGLTVAWLVLDPVRHALPALLVLAAAALLASSVLTRVLAEAGYPARQRHPLAVAARRAVAVAVLGVVVFLLVRPAGWDALTQVQRAHGQSVFAREASRIAGKRVTVICDTKGAHTGVLDDADGAAVVGGTQAWLDPHICSTLYDLGVRGRVDSFDGTSWAVLVLAHESWHLRGEANEGLANCFGMQSGVEAARRLGVGAGTAARMMRYRYALNLSEFSLGRAEYQLPPGCRSGGRYDLDPLLSRFP